MHNPLNPLAGQDPLDPLGNPMLDALARSIENPHVVADPLVANDEPFIDDLAAALGDLEDTIERTVVPPPVQPEPPVLAPIPSGPTSLGPTSKGPPPPPEPIERPWIEMQPPRAARPFLSHNGLAPSSYRPHGRAGTGIRNEGTSEMSRWCPAINQPVDDEACESCEYWDEDDEPESQCHYRLEENEDHSDETQE